MIKVTDKEFLEYSYKELDKAVELLGKVNLYTTEKARVHIKNLHKSYDVLFKLRNRLRKRVEENRDV